ncbi:DUF1439 domain-containing protein [Massilia sp. W12]|uniref:DUF1439 domain-containing protein n=1 Tax=Massilia sp. W12 TaxID=3126507 RepID=UPI0030D1C926
MLLRHAFVRACAALCLFFALTSCAMLPGGSHDVVIPLTKLQENVDKRFPITNRVLDMFDIRLQGPQLGLSGADGRVNARFELVLMPPFTSKTWRGMLKLSGALKVDGQKNALFLHDARIDDFSVDGADPVYKRQLNQIGSLLLDRFLQDIPLYTLQPDQMRVLGRDYALAKVAVRNDALVVTVAAK